MKKTTKTTEKLKALELSKIKLGVYSAMIILFTTFIESLQNLFIKSGGDKWRIISIVLFCIIVVLCYELVAVIWKKQGQIDYLSNELEIRQKLKDAEADRK